jgi:hypothetical protein
MTATNRFNGQPSHAADIPALCLQYLGVEPTLIEKLDRLRIPTHTRVQSRIDQNNAPDAQVKRYAHMMAESHFPAPLLTNDYITVDGNTRIKAHGVRADRYIEAWVLPIEYETADEDTKHKLKLLSLALNAMNGLPLEEKELLRYATELLRDNVVSDEEIVSKTGLAISKITALRQQRLAAERLFHLGINVDKLNLPDTTLRALGKPIALQLDDESYRGVLDLTKEAGLNGSAISGLAQSLKEATSPEMKRERMARERRALEPQILARQHGQEHKMYTDRLRKTLELLREHPASAFVEGNAEKAQGYVELLDKAIENLGEIRTLQLSLPSIAAEAQAATGARQ